MENATISTINVGDRYRKEIGDIDGLAASIAALGVLQPIGIDSNYNLIFGERRLRACQKLGLEKIPARVIHVDNLAAEHDENEMRKEFTISERVAIGRAREEHFSKEARERQLSGLKQNATVVPNSAQRSGAKTRDLAAAEAGFKRTSYSDASKVVDSGDQSLVEAMDGGSVSISAAADVATLPKDEQAEIVAKGEKEILQAAKDIRVAKAAVRKQENDKLKAESRAIPLPEGKYRTIVIDPPWEMKKIARDVAPDQVDFDYPTMSLDEIRAFPVADMAHEECIVYCWTTQKLLPETFGIIEAWGFQYLATMTWHKNGGFQPFGLPQYNSEFVLIGRKGGASFDDTKQFFLCNSWKRREHSRKPDEFYELVGRVSPGPRIDVFSREKRDGFDQFGNQTENF